MKFEAKKLAAIFKAIGNTSFAKKNTEDVEELNTVKIVAKNGNMQVISINSKIGVAYKIPDVDNSFSIMANNTMLPSCIEAAADSAGMVEFKAAENGAFVVGNATVPIPTGPVKQSQFTAVKCNPVVSALAADIVKAIDNVMVSIGKDTDLMKKVRLSFDTEQVLFKMTAFNGKMMAMANIPLEDMDEEKIVPQVLVEGAVLAAITPLLKLNNSEIIDVYMDNNRVMLAASNLMITFDYSTEEFVKCDQLLDKPFESYVTFNTIKLKKEINSIYKAVKDEITFIYDGNESKFVGNGGFAMPASFQAANNVQFSIPIAALKNIIAHITGETVTVSVESGALIRVKSDDSEDIVYVTGGVRH